LNSVSHRTFLNGSTITNQIIFIPSYLNSSSKATRLQLECTLARSHKCDLRAYTSPTLPILLRISYTRHRTRQGFIRRPHGVRLFRHREGSTGQYAIPPARCQHGFPMGYDRSGRPRCVCDTPRRLCLYRKTDE